MNTRYPCIHHSCFLGEKKMFVPVKSISIGVSVDFCRSGKNFSMK